MNNAKANPEMLAKMTAAGYPEEDIDNKLRDIDTLRTLNETQASEYSEQFVSTNAWEATQR